jgi:hypothetical protein
MYYMETESLYTYRALITLRLPVILPTNLINATEVMGQVLNGEWGYINTVDNCRQRQHELRSETLDELKEEVTAYIDDMIALLRFIKHLPETSILEVDI